MSSPAPHLLIVEDDTGLQSQLRWCFDGYRVLIAGTRAEALAHVRKHRPSVVTLDLGLPPDPGGVTEGLATLNDIRMLAPETKIIVVTGNDERTNAVNAIGLGAYDFYLKPIDAGTLRLVVDRAQALFNLEAENRLFQEKNQPGTPFANLITSSDNVLSLCREVEKVADTDAKVLLIGETGTGKELFARALHDLSRRTEARFVAVNCAAIPEQLLESELFGYEKGAFTGANRQTPGKIERADGGTFFLDEIGDLPLALQPKLLRFLQERVIERVGGREEIPVDVRIVSATHQDLQALAAQGRFREDLYYRLGEVVLQLPPLRERPGDAIVLAQAFLKRYNAHFSKSHRGFTPDALNAIDQYPWPGNVREIDGTVKKAVVMADGPVISAKDLGLQQDASETPTLSLTLREVRKQAETTAIRKAIAQADGNLSQAANLLGITRPTLYKLLEKYELKPNESQSQ
ncbi:PEP-CTERM-box response regulator transcription factor [Lamprobacter modestohalophilus]|uniref:PEP-CTERM-box response regulator transcription factor n=1 Tax=Lamprobacter modestohalophilus TaxID=1064514 RepID=A0A9X1B2H2_9GAMM|nr:PEP-CTERM-box response regulator transcription factor [Lamprobacter modestohalophilus]MBK1617398.1 PEP-CTERM-box response regulator transcription factor [Lamprobacter modestohalophilus]